MAQKRTTRRALLRTALMGSTGFAAAYLVGCGEDKMDSNGTPTATTTGASTPGRTTGVINTSSPEVPAGLSWRQLPNPGIAPAARQDHSVVSDGTLLLVYGGRGASVFGDLWIYDMIGGSWADASAAGAAPPARFGHNAVYDPTGHRMLVFGGQKDNTFYNDLWAYSLASGIWSQLEAGATSPSPRYGAASAVDPSGRLFISHGFTDTGRFDDSWSLRLRDPLAWSDVSPGASRPIARCLVRGAYDSGGNFLMFGGQTNQTPFLGDLWRLRSDTWTEITADPKPSPRNLYSFNFDSAKSSTILFGGKTEDGPSNDLWFFASRAEAWSAGLPEGDTPPARYGHDAAWISGSRKLIVFGGRDESGDLNDLWELTVPAS